MDIEKAKRIKKECEKIEVYEEMIRCLEEAWGYATKDVCEIRFNAPDYCLILPRKEVCAIITVIEEYFRGQIEVSETYLDGLE